MEREENADKSSPEEENYFTILKDLEAAEEHLQTVLGIAGETIDGLLEFPVCNYGNLQSLAKEYTDRLQNTYSLINRHADILELEPVVGAGMDLSYEIEQLKERRVEIEKMDQQLYPDIVFNPTDAMNVEEIENLEETKRK